MKKEIRVSKKARPHLKSFTPDRVKKEQTRKSGKGSSLMHYAAKKQSVKRAAESNMSPEAPVSGEPNPNRADYELSKLSGNNG